MITQKTWRDLLGPIDDDCFVDRNMISRHLQFGQSKMIWKFDNNKQAADVFRRWQEECSEAVS